MKYVSYDALNTKKRYPHVQSKVKTYIDNMRKEDQERRKVKLTRHRSEPSELAEWNASENLNESNATNWHLVLEKKNLEFDELKSRLNEMKTYGDTMNELLNAERLRVRHLAISSSHSKSFFISTTKCFFFNHFRESNFRKSWMQFGKILKL